MAFFLSFSTASLFRVSVLLALTNFANGKSLVPCYFIFGDSASDNGNNNNKRIDFLEGPTGRFSNGRTSLGAIENSYERREVQQQNKEQSSKQSSQIAWQKQIQRLPNPIKREKTIPCCKIGGGEIERGGELRLPNSTPCSNRMRYIFWNGIAANIAYTPDIKMKLPHLTFNN